MNRDKKRVVALAIRAALAVLAVVGLTAGVGAQTSDNYDLSWHVLAAGGSGMASEGYEVRTTAGQFAIGPADGSDYAVASGYWYGIRLLMRSYLPLVLKGYSP